jgi:hypothetical protein
MDFGKRSVRERIKMSEKKLDYLFTRKSIESSPIGDDVESLRHLQPRTSKAKKLGT